MAEFGAVLSGAGAEVFDPWPDDAATQLNPERNSDPFFQAAADSARRALFNPGCQPLKLPLDKYDQWQTFTITFDPKDIS